MFAGRHVELEKISTLLFQTKFGNPLNSIIVAERGFGKTSLLKYAKNLAQGKTHLDEKTRYDFIVVWLTLTHSCTLVELIEKFQQALGEALKERYPRLTWISEAWSNIKNFQVAWNGISITSKEAAQRNSELVSSFISDLATIIKKITQESAGAVDQAGPADGLLILIDEADKGNTDLGMFIKVVQEGLLSRDINNFSFILSGLPELIPQLEQSHPSSRRIFQSMPIGPLTKKDIEQAIHLGLERAQSHNHSLSTVTPEAIDRIELFSSGHPHYLQVIAHGAFEVDNDGKITHEDVELSFFNNPGTLKIIGDIYHRPIYFSEVFSAIQREVLHILAENPSDYISRKQIIAGITGNESSIDSAISGLRKKGIISTKKDQAGVYKIPDLLFALWVKFQRNIS
jgi:hypothetical protein